MEIEDDQVNPNHYPEAHRRIERVERFFQEQFTLNGQISGSSVTTHGLALNHYLRELGQEQKNWLPELVPIAEEIATMISSVRVHIEHEERPIESYRKRFAKNFAALAEAIRRHFRARGGPMHHAG